MDPTRLVAFVRREFAAAAVPSDAVPMAAYMKTDQPFFGVKKPARVPVYRAMKRDFAPPDREAYEAAVVALWREPEREMRYAAIEFATQHRGFVVPASMRLYEALIRDGAWWDLVDPIASHLVGGVWARWREETGPRMDRWIDDDDLWIRRTAIIGQLRHKADTDADRLFAYCLRRAHEREFFIRKAIGWALRQYAKTDPEVVTAFLVAHRDRLSGLSFREASKHLGIA